MNETLLAMIVGHHEGRGYHDVREDCPVLRRICGVLAMSARGWQEGWDRHQQVIKSASLVGHCEKFEGKRAVSGGDNPAYVVALAVDWAKVVDGKRQDINLASISPFEWQHGLSTCVRFGCPTNMTYSEMLRKVGE